MMVIVAGVCLILITFAAALSLWRLVAGPTVPDRTIAFDMVAVCIVATMAVLSVLWDTRLFIEIMLIYSLLGFVGTIAFVAYLVNNPARLLDGARQHWKRDKR